MPFCTAGCLPRSILKHLVPETMRLIELTTILMPESKLGVDPYTPPSVSDVADIVPVLSKSDAGSIAACEMLDHARMGVVQ